MTDQERQRLVLFGFALAEAWERFSEALISPADVTAARAALDEVNRLHAEAEDVGVQVAGVVVIQ